MRYLSSLLAISLVLALAPLTLDTLFVSSRVAGNVDGQDLAYLRKMLRAFKDKTASDLDGTMTMAAVPLTDEDIDILAHYAASLGK